MFKNYLAVAFRFLFRNKTYTIINVFGLAIGMAACLLIYLYIEEDLSWDRFHSKADTIWRVLTIDSNLGVTAQRVGITMPPVGPTLVDEFPEVEMTTRVGYFGNLNVVINDQHYPLNDVKLVDSTFFAMFDFQLVTGDPHEALNSPGDIVISQSAAERLYGDENPIGQIITLFDIEHSVSGIVADPPDQSHLQFDALISYTTAEKNFPGYGTQWGLISTPTYILAHSDMTLKSLGTRLTDMLRNHGVEEGFDITLQPLADVHLRSANVAFDPQFGKSDITYIYVFGAVAILILVIAAVNFMNLATARSTNRALEVGVRKVSGAVHWQLVQQFLGESILLAIISLILALVFVEAGLPLLNDVSGKELNLNLFSSPDTLMMIVVMVLGIGVIAGLYPAFVLAGFRPVVVLKGKRSGGRAGNYFRRALVVFQFALSTALIIGTGVVYTQLNYLQNKNMGFNAEQVITIRYPNGQITPQHEVFRDELLKCASILEVGNSSNIPGNTLGRRGARPEGYADGEDWILSQMVIDEHFIPAMDMQIALGRNFSPDFADSNSLILNETAVHELGWDDPIGKLFYLGDSANQQSFTIVGVVKDFHFLSARHVIEPVMLFFTNGRSRTNVSIRFKPEDTAATVEAIEKTWQDVFGDEPLAFQFMDERFMQLYERERNFSLIVTSFSVLAILIACLGLFGLSAYATEQRRKEIGIRKVLGASSSRVTLLLIMDFLRWVLLANLIAWPVAWYAMNRWLQDFAYRIELNAGVFLLATLIAFVIAIVTVTGLAMRAATSNPSDALRYE